MRLTKDELDIILAAPKFIDRALRYNDKGASHQEAKSIVRCPSLPDLNISIRSIFHKTRVPRRFTILLLINDQRVFSLDVCPAGIHTNPVTLEKVRGSHWHECPIDVAISDDRDLTHQAWFHEFGKRTSLTFEKGYTAPRFIEEERQLSFLGGDI